jgi:hypothetical protein
LKEIDARARKEKGNLDPWKKKKGLRNMSRLGE